MLPSVPRSKRTAALANSRFRQSLAVHSFTFCACVARPGRAAGPYAGAAAAARARPRGLVGLNPSHSRAFSNEIADRTLLLVHLVHASAFFGFSARLADFLPRKNSGASTQKHQCRDHENTSACTQKHQCLHSKTPMPRPQKHQCLRPKTPMPRSQKPQCLRAKTPLPGHPMWPRPSAYTREFPKLTCVGTGPRPR